MSGNKPIIAETAQVKKMTAMHLRDVTLPRCKTGLQMEMYL